MASSYIIRRDISLPHVPGRRSNSVARKTVEANPIMLLPYKSRTIMKFTTLYPCSDLIGRATRPLSDPIHLRNSPGRESPKQLLQTHSLVTAISRGTNDKIVAFVRRYLGTDCHHASQWTIYRHYMSALTLLCFGVP